VVPKLPRLPPDKSGTKVTSEQRDKPHVTAD
jgi:hypothetical protein